MNASTLERFRPPDHLGSSSTLTDSNGYVVIRDRYSAFGERRQGESSAALITDQLYTAQRYNALSSLYHYSNGKSAGRFYDPLLGRFISADMVTPGNHSQALNRFSYVLNNPLRLVDPDGRCPALPSRYSSGICFALFIKPPQITAGPIVPKGDGRDFGYASDPAASRVYFWINPDTGTYEAFANPSGYVFGFLNPVTGEYTQSIVYFSPSSQNSWQVAFNDDGSIIVTYSVVIAGYLEGAADRLNGTIIFRPDGKGGYTSSGDRDGFPWAEAYYRTRQGEVQTIFQKPAVRGDPYDLGVYEEPQPFWNLPYQIRNGVQYIREAWPFNDPPLPDIWGAE